MDTSSVCVSVLRKLFLYVFLDFVVTSSTGDGLYRFGVDDDRLLNFCKAAMNDIFLGPRTFCFGFSLSLLRGKDGKLCFLLLELESLLTPP